MASVTNFAVQLSAAAAARPAGAAVKLDDQVLSYGELDEAVSRAAGLLSAWGVGIGDRVGMQLPNVPYFPIVYFGALKLGAIGVPMNPLLKEAEVAYQLSDSGARLIIGWPGLQAAARAGGEAAGAEYVMVAPGEFEDMLAAAAPVGDVVDRADEDPAVIIYTSGTTGTPKGASLTHANLLAAAAVGRDLVDAGPDTVAVGTLPLFHVFGMNSIMNVSVIARGLLTLIGRFDPETVLTVIERDRATTFGGVPTMYAALLHHPDPRGTTYPASTCASRAVPRCRSRCCVASTRRSAPRCWRATAYRRPPGWRRSTRASGSASRAR